MAPQNELAKGLGRDARESTAAEHDQHENTAPRLDYAIGPISDLDGYYLQYQIWAREITPEMIDEGVICQAFDENDMEIGKLALDGEGKILIVEVEPEYRRQGIATRMLTELREAGYSVEHDWENMRDDGDAWARSVDKHAR